VRYNVQSAVFVRCLHISKLGHEGKISPYMYSKPSLKQFF